MIFPFIREKWKNPPLKLHSYMPLKLHTYMPFCKRGKRLSFWAFVVDGWTRWEVANYIYSLQRPLVTWSYLGKLGPLVGPKLREGLVVDGWMDPRSDQWPLSDVIGTRNWHVDLMLFNMTSTCIWKGWLTFGKPRSEGQKNLVWAFLACCLALSY
jgi:hypothetical protein